MSPKPWFRRIGYGLAVTAWLVAVSLGHASPWAKVKATAPGPAAAIGGPSNGCIVGAQVLPAEGAGFTSIRRNRNRFYGHPDTIRFVQRLGRALRKHTHRQMMVGDLAQPRGGLMSSLHRSHQNGLDVDIWFRLAGPARNANGWHREEGDPPSMVAPGGLDLSKDWGNDQRFLLKASADDPRVDRIFVNPAIKRALCRSEKGNRKWLRKLRPWWGHDAHFHVRLKCPQDSPLCKQQASLPAGNGCDKSLAWWFSDEARAPAKKPRKKKPGPAMPAACAALLSGL